MEIRRLAMPDKDQALDVGFFVDLETRVWQALVDGIVSGLLHAPSS